MLLANISFLFVWSSLLYCVLCASFAVWSWQYEHVSNEDSAVSMLTVRLYQCVLLVIAVLICTVHLFHCAVHHSVCHDNYIHHAAMLYNLCIIKQFLPQLYIVTTPFKVSALHILVDFCQWMTYIVRNVVCWCVPEISGFSYKQMVIAWNAARFM